MMVMVMMVRMVRMAAAGTAARSHLRLAHVQCLQVGQLGDGRWNGPDEVVVVQLPCSTERCDEGLWCVSGWRARAGVQSCNEAIGARDATPAIGTRVSRKPIGAIAPAGTVCGGEQITQCRDYAPVAW